MTAIDFSDTSAVELGLDTFGDVTVDHAGNRLSEAEVIRNVVDEAVLADRLGLDFFGVGEHHRDDFAVSSPETVLAAIAARTERIRLGSAVTVLSSDDPIRVYQRFATLDALSDGRAEVILGRGSFTESFPLFGFPLDRYEELFEEKLDLFTHLLREQPVTWSGTTRPPVPGLQVYPRTAGGLRAWVGVGGSPESVVRAARHGLPLMLAIIGGSPARFRPYVDLYHRALGEFGHEPLPVGVHSPGHVAPTDEQALEELWPHWKPMRDRIGAERGWPPVEPCRVRERCRSRRRAPRRLAGERRTQDRHDDRGARREPLRHEVLRRHPAPRDDDAQHRAVRHRGGTQGPRTPHLAGGFHRCRQLHSVTCTRGRKRLTFAPLPVSIAWVARGVEMNRTSSLASGFGVCCRST